MAENAIGPHGNDEAQFGKVYTVSDNDTYQGRHYVSLKELHPNNFYHEEEFEPVCVISELIEILESQPAEV